MKRILMNLAFTATAILLISTGQVKVKAAEANSITYEKNIDIVKDYVIDTKDIATLAKEYNKTNKSTGWNSNNDINSDGIIDVYDLIAISKNIGKKITIEKFSDYDFAEVGQKYTLQTSVRAKLGDKDYVKLPVKWNTSANTSAAGKYTHTGVIEGYNKSLSFDLTVVPVNEYSNLNLIPILTYDGNYIYYINGFPEVGTYKANIDGSNAKKINDDLGIFMKVYNGWLYYINSHDYCIYKVRTDGSSKVLVSEGHYDFLRIYNGKLYCIDSYDEVLYSMNLDGSNKRSILEDAYAPYLYFVDNYIYFVDYIPGISKIYRINLDGTSMKVIKFPNVDIINVSGKYIYYINYSDNYMYRANIDGTNIELLSTDYPEFEGMCIVGDWIYYLCEDDNYYGYVLRRSKIDGSMNEQIIDKGILIPNIRCGRIYFIGDDGYVYTAKMDGTDLRLLNE